MGKGHALMCREAGRSGSSKEELRTPRQREKARVGPGWGPGGQGTPEMRPQGQVREKNRVREEDERGARGGWEGLVKGKGPRKVRGGWAQPADSRRKLLGSGAWREASVP